MFSFADIIAIAAVLSVARGHGVIIGAQGLAGSPTSVGFQVSPDIARNCTSINPCQQDATLIRDAEINANIVNECGRTELTGNIDVGENTENALAAGAVTQVSSGSSLTVTIHQVNADGAGPYACDMDPTSNSLGATGQIPLEVTNNVPGVNGFSQAKAQQFDINIKMPANFTCTGASTGDICTIRCRNNALAGPFGGCFAVQQTDTTTKTNVASEITTLKDLDTVLKQVELNQADLPAAVSAIQNAGSDAALQNAALANSLLGFTVTTKASPVQTPVLAAVANAAATTTAAAAAAAGNSTSNGAKGGARAGNRKNQNGDNQAGNNQAGDNQAGDNQNDNNQNGNNQNGNNNDKRTVLRWAKRAAN